jgi:3-dehydrosphinganine reductase
VNPDQILTAHSHSLASLSESKLALENAAKPHGGRAPDGIFTCAGISTPDFFLTAEEKDLKDGMTNAYWIQAFPALVRFYVS